MQNLIGTEFVVGGVTLRVHAYTPQYGYEIRSVGGPGVWFATGAQLRAAGVTA